MPRNDSVNPSDLVAAEGHRLLAQALDLLSSLPNQLRQTLADHQWSTIPLMLKEGGFNGALAAGQPLVPQLQFQGLVLITSVTVVLPAGAGGGQLVLGRDVTIVMQPGLNHIAPLQLLLQGDDQRILSYASGGPGPASVLLTGQQMPTTGVLAR